MRRLTTERVKVKVTFVISTLSGDIHKTTFDLVHKVFVMEHQQLFSSQIDFTSNFLNFSAIFLGIISFSSSPISSHRFRIEKKTFSIFQLLLLEK